MTEYKLSKNIYLFRHGETDWNVIHRGQGCENDIPLNDKGREQATTVGKYLSMTNIKADLIISSNMSRANETAQIIGKHINYQSPILIIDNLKEVCHGKLGGLTSDELKSNQDFDKYIELQNAYNKEKDPIKQRELYYSHNIILNKLYGSELYRDSRHRFKKALKEIYNRTEQNIIVVAHGGTIIQLLQLITNISDYIRGDYKYGSNCHMTYIQLFEKNFNLKTKRKIKIIKYLTSDHLNYTNSITPHIESNHTVYNENVSEPWFTLISLGLKTIEGRKNKGRFKDMQVGDMIKWTNNDFNPRTTSTIITKKNIYDTFEEYLQKEGLNRCLPGITNIKDGLSVYFKYFTKEDEANYGVVAIQLKLIK